jgi:hypothetical protein
MQEKGEKRFQACLGRLHSSFAWQPMLNWHAQIHDLVDLEKNGIQEIRMQLQKRRDDILLDALAMPSFSFELNLHIAWIPPPTRVRPRQPRKSFAQTRLFLPPNLLRSPPTSPACGHYVAYGSLCTPYRTTLVKLGVD